MRFELDLYVNLRPIKLYDASLCPLKDKGPEDIDMVFVRENTEDAYSGAHGFTHKGQPHEVATQTMVYTRGGVERGHPLRLRAGPQAPQAQVTSP